MNTLPLRLPIRVAVKTTEKKGASALGGYADSPATGVEVCAFDGGKKVRNAAIKGRKRHIVVDSQELLIGVLVTEANASERLGAVVVLHEAVEKLSKLKVVWVDSGYLGNNFAHAVQQVCGEQVRVEVLIAQLESISSFTEAVDC